MRYQVIDNSGGLEAQLIGTLKNRKGNIGDIIIVSIIKALPNKKVKKGEIYKAVILRSKIGIRRKDGTWIRFGENGLVLLTPEFVPVATRIFGPVPLEIQSLKKLAHLVSHFI